jgi:hypothetical protein
MAAEALPGVQVDGKEQLLVQRRIRGGLSCGFFVEEPTHVEAEDLLDWSDDFAAAVLDPRWYVFISIPASADDRDRQLALRVARDLAKQAQGAAYDPQEDVVIWPCGRTTRFTTPREETPIDVLLLEWMYTASQADETPQGLLRILQRAAPEALPTRYGSTEPFAHRLDREGPDHFVEACRTWRSMSWNTRPPFRGGSYFGRTDSPHRSKRAEVHRLDSLPATAKASLWVDGRAFEDDRWNEAIARAFVLIGNETDSFYGSAWLWGGWVADARGRIWWRLGGQAMRYKTDGCVFGRWVGVPDRPAWLVWYGKPYAKLLDERHGTPFGGGRFYQSSDRPAWDVERPPVPPELVGWSDPTSRDARPAELIPAL